MSITAKGNALNIASPIIGIINKSPTAQYYEIKNGHSINNGIIAAIIEDTAKINHLGVPVVNLKPGLLTLLDGDIVMLNPNGYVSILFRANSQQNYLFVTEQCNSKCLMCPQPPKKRDDMDYYFDINMKVINLLPQDMSVIGITGGEPTLLGEKLSILLANISQKLPETEVHLLTNGRALAWNNNVQKLVAIPRHTVIYAISLHSDYYISHDYQAQCRHAFTQSLLGIHNLGRYDRRVEIRVIINKLNAHRLSKMAEFIYRNMPFVEHIAFMGLELMGYCKMNFDRLWVNPSDYIEQLREATMMLAQNRIAVSIYNLPLCSLPDDLREFSRKSITEWKIRFPDECAGCNVISECGGIFNSWSKVKEGIINPILS